MNIPGKLAFLCVLPVLSGCISLRFGDSSRDENSFFEMNGLAHAYGEVVNWDDYDGPNFGIDVLSNLGDGEVAAVDLGPIFGVGVGLAGFRLRIWPIDFGVGVLAYDPEDANHINKRKKDRVQEEEEEYEEEDKDREHEEADEHEAKQDEKPAKHRTGKLR